jgi:hypothetical protein
MVEAVRESGLLPNFLPFISSAVRDQLAAHQVRKCKSHRTPCPRRRPFQLFRQEWQ